MTVVCDTTVWSVVFRRARPLEEHVPHVEELLLLTREGRARVLGVVRQEFLTGVGDAVRFEALRARVAAFPDLLVVPRDHVRAAEMANDCRHRGVATTTVDMLICAVAERSNAPIYTLDRDFPRYAKHLPITLHAPRR